MSIIDQLLQKYPLISAQVDVQDVRIILTELQRVLDANVAGDLVEFGCYLGTTSLFIQRLLGEQDHQGRQFHVYDSFEGLPSKSRHDESPAGVHFQPGVLAISKKQLLREFQKARLQPPIIHKRWFHDLTATDVPRNIAFAFLDGDFYDSIKKSLQLVRPRLAAGGTIILHDYARDALPGVAKAARELGLQPTVQHNLGIIRMPLPL